MILGTLYGILVCHLFYGGVYLLAKRIGWVIRVETVREHSQTGEHSTL